ncbi:alpha/beta fold hydrolase [Sandaracinus amylolyticus]|uniref:Putative esterase n=1 Tax=Sandaracinus amylolyticus TaxID=927083 RepID=A0A0F6W3X3_9BACT|nr:alpha/beta fold hydrolase [Sandaracinus amylolyticus]AKF06850.1 putative esterase [Sandaracinus amylolyticus]
MSEEGTKGTSRRQFVELAAATAAMTGAAALGTSRAHAHRGGGHGRGAHFVLVHGAWHGAWCWYEVVPELERWGHRVTVVDLPSHGIDAAPPGTVTLDDYASRVISVIDALDEPVVLVGHSMGGVVISTVAEALPEKIDKLVYLTAFLLRDGQSLFDVASTDAGSLATPNLLPDPGAGTIDVRRSEIRDIFYHRCSDAHVQLARSLLKVNPLAPIVTPLSLTSEGFGSVRRFYVECLEDQAISIAAQRAMVAATPCEEVLRMRTDHSPFFSEVPTLVRHLTRIASR